MRETWINCKYNIIYFGLPFFGGLSLVLLSFIMLTWYIMLLIIVIGCVLMYKFFYLLKTIRISQHVDDGKYSIVRLEQHAIIKYGKAGSGKSFTGVAEAVFGAQVLWCQINREYEVMKKLLLDHKYANDEKFLINYYELRKSIEFWNSHPEAIPCLFSNIPIESHGRMSMQLEMKHLLQEKWLPSHTMLFLDEIGRWLGVEKSSSANKIEAINDFICWIRQFVEARLIATEQRATNIMIDLRGVVGVNERIISMKKKSTASFLLRIIERVKTRAISKGYSVEFFDKLHRLQKWAERVGFLVFVIEEVGNIDDKEAVTNTREVWILANTPFNYESRAFRYLYLAKDLPDDNEVASSMFVSEYGELAQSLYARYEEKAK